MKLEASNNYESSIRLDKLKDTAPCVGACPAHVDIPGYIALANEGRYDEAVDLIRQDNPLPLVCGLVCVHPCEMKCRRINSGKAVNIRAIKRFVAENETFNKVEACASTGSKIAIVGGGPAGLSCAYYLRLMGHEVTIYEQFEKLGGMLRYGIPDYRLPQEKLDKEINQIISYGIEVKTATKIGTDISYEELETKYDRIFIAIGDHYDKKIGIENEDAKNVIAAVDLLHTLGEGKTVDLKDKVVLVIGGGNVAMDALRSAVRLQAKEVQCIYRRAREQMPANDEEIEGAIEEGVIMRNLQAPLRIEVDDNNQVVALWTTPQELGEPGSDGRRKPQPIPNATPLRIPCDYVVSAIGQQGDFTGLEGYDLEMKWGNIVVDENYMVPSNDKFYAGGDITSGPDTVIRAIEAGKQAAYAIDVSLGFNHQIKWNGTLPEITPPNIKEVRNELPFVDPSIRKANFEEIELPYTKEECTRECSRCLRCDRPIVK